MSQYQNNKSFLKVKRSPAGLGLFANENIPEGTFIIEYTGELIKMQIADSRGGKYLFKLNSRWAIDGKDRKNLARYINHFCKPNCQVQITRNMIFIYAIRDIIKGEEIGYNYGQEYFLAYIKPKGCKCPYCRIKKLIS